MRRIGQILQELNLKTESFVSSDVETPSVRMNIAEPGLSELQIGTNGKGMTLPYAEASAAGEFMERLSGGFLLRRERAVRDLTPRNIQMIRDLYPETVGEWERMGILPGCELVPDETVLEGAEAEEVLSRFSSLYENPAIRTAMRRRRFCVTLPFWGYREKSLQLIPYDAVLLACGSNGMCAGNTPHEALLQGTYEIIERYVIRRIVLERRALPTVSHACFSDAPVLHALNSLSQRSHCSFCIKDCSLGEGWPAIGLLLVDYVNHRYHFHVGVDRNPETALERCLTETMQGRHDVDWQPMDPAVTDAMSGDEEEREIQLYHTFRDGTGQFPLRILENVGQEVSDVHFIEFSEDEDDAKDLKILLEAISSRGFSPYIRDFSWTGFPAYHVYIEGMSIVNHSESIIHNLSVPVRYSYTLSRFLWTLHDVPTDKLASVLAEATARVKTDDGVSWRSILSNADNAPSVKQVEYVLSFMLENYEQLAPSLAAPRLLDFWRSNSVSLLRAVLYVRLGRREKAKLLFEEIAKHTVEPLKKLFYQFASDMCSGRTDTELDAMYTPSFCARVSKALLHDSYTKLFDVTPCFNCSACTHGKDCLLVPLLQLSKKWELLYSERSVDQCKLKMLFE